MQESFCNLWELYIGSFFSRTVDRQNICDTIDWVKAVGWVFVQHLGLCVLSSCNYIHVCRRMKNDTNAGMSWLFSVFRSHMIAKRSQWTVRMSQKTHIKKVFFIQHESHTFHFLTHHRPHPLVWLAFFSLILDYFCFVHHNGNTQRNWSTFIAET